MKSLDLALRKTLIVYGICGTLLAFGVELWTPYRMISVLGWLMIPALALATEFLPVRISRNGLRITFSLPFVAGMAVATGATGALLVDLLVTLAAALYLRSKQEKGVKSYWILLNLSVCLISASLAGFVFHFATNSGSGHTTLGALAFTITYAVANFLLVCNADATMSLGRFKERVHSTAAIAAQGMLLYCLAAVAVAILVSKELYLFLPLMLLPLVVLRRVLKLKALLFEQYYESVTALTLMLQRAHPYTHGHLERVSRISEEVALRLGLSGPRARLVREASVLHDIGKIAVDEAILDKPARLTDEEFTHVKRHSVLGAQILAPVEALREVVPWIRHHHERPDGTGYPDGLSDVEIPIESKIIAVVDAFDAMTGGDAPSDRRPYREPMTVDQALQELDRCSGTQFDARVVQAFRYVLGSGVV
ncbi:MAG TPA: HD-GYP domain-containing protein [Fimbriimonadaceae bacterium]